MIFSKKFQRKVNEEIKSISLKMDSAEHRLAILSQTVNFKCSVIVSYLENIDASLSGIKEFVSKLELEIACGGALTSNIEKSKSDK